MKLSKYQKVKNRLAATPLAGAVMLLCFLLVCGQLAARLPIQYQINKTNILPSDKVYSLLQDKLGYLWIATEKGVVRYNGYNVQLYNKAAGLPTNDIWSMIDDNSGRVWMGGTAGQIGYVINNKYHPAILKNISGTIFPYYLHRLDSGIIFSTWYVNGGTAPSICISKQDTIIPYEITESKLSGSENTRKEVLLHINSSQEAYVALADNYYRLSNVRCLTTDPKQLRITSTSNTSNFIRLTYGSGKTSFLCGAYYVFYTPGLSNMFHTIDARTGRVDSFSLQSGGNNEPIEYMAYSIDRMQQNKLFAYTGTTCFVYRLSAGPQVEGKYEFSHIVGRNKDGHKVVQYAQLPLWDTVVATSAHGVFISAQTGANMFRHQAGVSLAGYTCVGVVYDSLSYWWSAAEKKVVVMCNGKIRNSYPTKGFTINHVSAFGKDSLLLTGSFSHFLIPGNQQMHRLGHGIFGASLIRMMEYKPRCFFVLSNTGAYNLRPDYNMDSMNRKYLAVDRFSDAVPDWYHGTMIAYHQSKLLVFDEKTRKTYTAGQINRLTNDPIDNVCADATYGNIFVKSGDNIFLFDPISGTSNKIPADAVYRNATIEVWKNYLVVAGDFGASFYLIKGTGTLSTPITYLNAKKGLYKEISGVCLSGGQLLMQTDAGLYTASVPQYEAFEHNSQKDIPYRLIIEEHHQRLLNNGDTLRLDNNTRVLYTDVINPLGNGNVRIYYRFGGAKEWTKCNDNEIVRPEFVVPDRYYRFEIYCEDDGWRSHVTSASIWVQPTWWQKRTTRYMLWAGGVLLVIGIVSISTYATRQMVEKAQQKKQMQLELELKAIYAQINPHFIFNALTSAMLLVRRDRMDEAYLHVSKFSRLLRNYLNSSRNRYISIADEVANLTNYMDLQQTRFKNRFEATITVADNLDTQFRIPSLLILPFVENAINFGVLPSDRVGKVIIALKPIPDGVQCIISDNGVGREASRLKNHDKDAKDGTKDSLQVKDLIKVYNKYEEMSIQIRYRDRSWPDSGTDVIIDICYMH